MYKKWVLLFFLPLCTLAQSDFSGGLLPRVNASFKLADRLKLNSSVELRQQLFDLSTLENGDDVFFVLGDWANTFSYKISSHTKLNLGYTLRSRSGALHHRLTQQLSLVDKKSFFRLGHRFGLDQTFIPSNETVFRGRYRISFEKPLNGTEVDPKEFYLKLNNEYLAIFTNSNSDFEIRGVPYLGYEFNKTNKLEVGLDYRLSDFTSAQLSHRLWMSMVYYISL